MAIERYLKWYSPFLFLLGAILSFADPITDTLTLVEFYRTDHKTWFSVGLVFVILPCLGYSILECTRRNLSFNIRQWSRTCLRAVLRGFNPFSAPLVILEGFFLSQEMATWTENQLRQRLGSATYTLLH